MRGRLGRGVKGWEERRVLEGRTPETSVMTIAGGVDILIVTGLRDEYAQVLEVSAGASREADGHGNHGNPSRLCQGSAKLSGSLAGFMSRFVCSVWTENT